MDGDQASGEVLCVAHHLSRPPTRRGGPAGSAGTDMVWFIRYRDDYRRTDAGWRFVAGSSTSSGSRSTRSGLVTLRPAAPTTAPERRDQAGGTGCGGGGPT